MLWKLLTLHTEHSQWTNSSPKTCEAICSSQVKHPESPWHGGSQISLVEFPAQMCDYRIWKITANRSVCYQSYVYPGKITAHPALKHTSQVASRCKLLCTDQTSLCSSASSSCLYVTEPRLQVKPPRPGRLHTPSKCSESSQRLHNRPRKKISG